LEDRRVHKTAIIVEGEKAVNENNLGREHGNRGKSFLDKIDGKERKISEK